LLAVVAVFFYIQPTSDEKASSEKKGSSLLESDQVLSLKRTLITGGIGGFLAALAGIGGGVAMVPIMSLLFGLRISKAVSISSLAIVFISTSGWVQFALDSPETVLHTQFSVGYVDFATVLPLAITSLIGGFFGVKIGKRVSERVSAIGFAILTLIVAVVMILRVL
jgi:uncharacterized membrane protein YfcA